MAAFSKAVMFRVTGSARRQISIWFFSVAVLLSSCDPASETASPIESAKLSPALHALQISYSGGRFPILFTGESVDLSHDLTSIEFFSPLFGNDRPAVNQAMPQIEAKRRLTFHLAGEYYLRMNGTLPVRVLVLPRTLDYSSHALRIFDFVTANLVVCDGDDNEYHKDRIAYIDKWFRSEGPAALLCGSNSDLFNELVESRLSLPTRVAGFPGFYFYLSNGPVVQAAHTVAEVYLPDQGKFVMFDLNKSLVVRWKNAVELANIVNARTGPDARLTRSEIARLKLDIYTGVPARFAARSLTCGSALTEPTSVAARLVTDVPVERDWREEEGKYCTHPLCSLACNLAGGVIYWPAEWAGTGFLRSALFRNFHTEPQLKQVSLDFLKTRFDLSEVQIVDDAELEYLLSSGFAGEIKAEKWRERIPPLPSRHGQP